MPPEYAVENCNHYRMYVCIFEETCNVNYILELVGASLKLTFPSNRSTCVLQHTKIIHEGIDSNCSFSHVVLSYILFH